MKINLTDIPILQEEEGVMFCPKCGNYELCWNEEIQFYNICCECETVIEIPDKKKK